MQRSGLSASQKIFLKVLNAMTRFLIALVKFYQRWLSPLKAPCCRFVPTCSAYAVDALTKYGWLRGGWLTVKRILRCNPFCKGGYDPVP